MTQVHEDAQSQASKAPDGNRRRFFGKAASAVVAAPLIGPPMIAVRGAGQHNLKAVGLDIPRGAMTVWCGPSGSGKTSLAFDTLYAEGQRRYVESLSPYARQFVGQVPKPVFERIDGLSPAVAIEQRSTGSTPRSTVGTLTEMYDYFRVLAARLGVMHCPACGVATAAQLARLYAELASDIDHPRWPDPSTDMVPVLRIDETGLDEHQQPIWFSRTWFPPGAMSFELMRHRSRAFP